MVLLDGRDQSVEEVALEEADLEPELLLPVTCPSEQAARRVAAAP
jgi:hypothetical protein